METKKHIYKLLCNISNGDYAKSKNDVSSIIEGKISEKISKISKSK
jgi:hypothetical protein